MSKNKFKCDPPRRGSVGGATYEINSDGTITVNGTVIGSSSFTIPLGTYTFTSSVPMIVSGADPENRSAISLDRNNQERQYERGDGLLVELDGSWNVRLVVYSGTTYDNVTFYPMIRLATIADDSWEPYFDSQGTVNIGKNARSLEISDLLDGYSAVHIITGTDENGEDTVIEVGNTAGRTLTIKNEFGTPQMAENILASIRGYQYRPMTARSAILDPAAELGDAVIVNGIHSGLYHIETSFDRLMASNIASPIVEEITHEYGYDTSTDRQYKRFVGKTQSTLSINSREIRAEVTRATEAEGNLRSGITQTANKITAEITRATESESLIRSEVSKIEQTASRISARVSSVETDKLDAVGGITNSFAWNLTDTAFTLTSNSQEVFRADRSGIKIKGNAEVTGKITATSGFIGNGSSGFTIGSNAIYNGKTSLTDNNNGVYISTSGIALGRNSAFRVSNTGAVTASNLSITGGSINIGNNFRVDSYGNLSANSGTFSGNVYAGNIQWGGDYGTFDGYGITPYSVSGYDKIEQYSVTGGTGGNLAYETVDTSNTSSGINTSLGYADYAASVFYGIVTADYLAAHEITSGTRMSIGGDFYFGGYSVRWGTADEGSLVLVNG